MKKAGAIGIGVLLVVLFSVWPMRLVNLVCCFGIAFSGAAAVALTARGAGGRMESVNGFSIGVMVGALGAVATLILNLLMHVFGVELPLPGAYFDALPTFFGTFIEMGWDGVRDIFERATVDDHYDAGVWGRFFINLVSNSVFGGFGGVIGASLYPGTRVTREEGQALPDGVRGESRRHDS